MLHESTQKCISLQMLEYDDFQSGFRENQNFETAVQCVKKDYKETFHKGKETVVVYLDFKRALETVDKVKLLQKLKHLGFGDSVLDWVTDYSSNKCQIVCYKRMKSTERNIDVNIPQGNIQWPNLFEWYFLNNDMVFYDLFANDIILYLTGYDMNEVLSWLNEWIIKNGKWLYEGKQIEEIECIQSYGSINTKNVIHIHI